MFFREAQNELEDRLKHFPAVALLGPRQCGKSTLAREFTGALTGSVMLDLERPNDLQQLTDIEAFVTLNPKGLICLDEVQRAPEIFAPLRYFIDREKKNGRFLFLGSASRDLLRQSSESLAGRISYLELTPFHLGEVHKKNSDWRKLWVRGGFPRSFLAASDKVSVGWREDFVQTYLERDIPQLGFNIPAAVLRRLWLLIAHSQGQLLNLSAFGRTLGFSQQTIRDYISILENTFLVRLLRPFEANTRKRFVKAPKVYIRDSGLLHSLLQIGSFRDLYSHPVYGFSFEGFVIENIMANATGFECFFFRTATGDEIDLVLQKGRRTIAVEIKASTAPQLTKEFYRAVEIVKPTETWCVAPVEKPYVVGQVRVTNLAAFIGNLRGTKE